MNQRLLSRLLFAYGMLVVSVYGLMDVRWSNASTIGHVLFVVALLAAFVGIGLDVKHRREDRRSTPEDRVV